MSATEQPATTTPLNLYARRTSRQYDVRRLTPMDRPLDSSDRTSLRPSIAHGFLPLPPIIASPMCTPTSSSSCHDESDSRSSSTASFTTAPTTPASATSPHSLLPPTWISIPPTPPPRLSKRSVTCLTRSVSTSVTPSTSFPIASAHRRTAVRSASTHHVSRPSILPSLNMEFTSATNPMFGPDPIFYICHEVASDQEDDSPVSDLSTASPTHPTRHLATDDGWRLDKLKDDRRKYHALLELLSSEASYLTDLRTLVMIYLSSLTKVSVQQTPVSSTFGRSSSFSSLSRATSLNHLQMSALAVTDHSPVKDRFTTRPLLNSDQTAMLSRNIESILEFHQQFVQELQQSMGPFGFTNDLEHRLLLPEEAECCMDYCVPNIDAAISVVCTKFATEASRFSAYEAFCAGHSNAMNVVRDSQHQYSSEWEAFEHLCSSLLTGGSFSSMSSGVSEGKADQPSPSRSINGFSSPSKHPSEAPSTRPTGVSNPSSSKSLSFADYLIKPIQRICKYPLLLQQLLPGKGAPTPPPNVSSPNTSIVVESAILAMRHVASLVDNARHRQEVALQSSLILSRISATLPSLTSSHSPLTFLTPSFLSSLGTCLLAGSLDVMYNPAFDPSANAAVAKYLGAFLYLGGYLILVKVCKSRTYEPRHWFRLVDFELLDITEEDAMIPFSFRLSSNGHEFELAAACQREKVAWMTSIREALNHSSSAWINEPLPSFNIDEGYEYIPSNLDGQPFEAVHVVHPGNSRASPAQVNQRESWIETLDSLPPDRREGKTEHPPSRRSSTASVKAIFSPLTSNPHTILIRRPTPSSRSVVDQGLRDVISEPCINARSYATSHDEELFHTTYLVRNAHASRSSSALSISKGRIKRHESIRVPRRRLTASERPLSMKRSTSRSRSVKARRRSKTLSMTSTDSEGFTAPSRTTNSSPARQVPYETSKGGQSACVNPPFYLATSQGKGSNTAKIFERHPNSLVSSVRGLFFSRPTSPVPDDCHLSLGATPNRSILKRWIKGAKHQRSKSAPKDLLNLHAPTAPL